jgi:DHA2 family methylenomycin A resistance protein-like MFS transporter
LPPFAILSRNISGDRHSSTAAEPSAALDYFSDFAGSVNVPLPDSRGIGHADASSDRRARSNLLLVVTCSAAFMTSLDVTIVNVALPTIHATLGGSIAGLQWVGVGYALAFGCLLLTGGALSDRYGARDAFTAGVAVFTAGSALCAASGNLLALNLARAVQGVGAALVVPAILALLREAYPDRISRARAIAIYAASGGIAQVAGPVLGGILVTGLGWPSIFVINVPIGMAVMAATLARVPASASKPPRRLDLPGQIAAIVWLASVAWALIGVGQLGWRSPRVAAAFMLSAAAFWAFAKLQRRRPDPLLPLADLRNPKVAALLIIAAILQFAYFGQFFVLAIFFQDAWGADPMRAGLAFLPMTAGVTLANLTIGPRVGQIGSRLPMIGGQALCAAGYLGLCGVDEQTGYGSIAILFALIGVGGGLVVPAMTSAVLEAVGPERVGITSGILNASRQMGGVIGIALFGSLIARSGLIAGLHQSLIVAAIAMVGGCLLAIFHGSRLEKPLRHI